MPSKQIFNTSRQKPIRQTLRNNLTTPEQKLWTKIRSKQLGARFRRQYGIGRYVVDFYCPELGLVIELDGDSHYQDGAQEYDQVRDAFMESLGLRVLRFTNADVMSNLDGVLEEIKGTPSQPPPLKRGGAKGNCTPSQSPPLKRGGAKGNCTPSQPPP